MIKVDTVGLLESAIKAGYNHLDTAEIYETEEGLSQAVKNTGAKREELYLTTKVSLSMEDPVAGLDASLARLKVDYVDLYLIHNPFECINRGVSFGHAWKAMETCYKQGKAKAIGVSNFRVEDLEKVFETAEIKPMVNQIEFSAYLQNQSPGIVKFCQENDILVEGYSPMGVFLPVNKNGPLLPLFDELAKKYKKTPAQINLRWVYQAKDILPITTSTKAARIKENLDFFDFELTKEDADKITEVGNSFFYRQFFKGKY